jgi:membrane-bound metal-dependent hydrolase YbcI (DUF457 family)
MFVGHLAVALGAKRAAPDVPLSALITAALGLDLVWPWLLLAGLETVRVDPGNTAFTPVAFDHYPWSHSLLMALAWAALAGGLAFAAWRSTFSGFVVAALVASHWLLDWLTHRPDLPLWPGGPQQGLGLWNSIAGTLLVEGALFLVMVETYRRAFPPRDRTGRWSFWSLVVFTGTLWVTSPWSPPPPSMKAIAVVGIATWMFPVWGAWIERHREPTVG